MSKKLRFESAPVFLYRGQVVAVGTGALYAQYLPAEQIEMLLAAFKAQHRTFLTGHQRAHANAWMFDLLIMRSSLRIVEKRKEWYRLRAENKKERVQQMREMQGKVRRPWYLVSNRQQP